MKRGIYIALDNTVSGSADIFKVDGSSSVDPTINSSQIEIQSNPLSV